MNGNLVTGAVDPLSIGLSALALVVAVYGVWQSKRSADAASRSERHGARSAAAAETSAAHSQRSADAAERSASTQEEALEIERRRAAGERVKAAHEQAPKWESISDGPEGSFRLANGFLEGGLRNAGLTGARIEVVVLDLPSGGRLPVDTRRDPPGVASGGWESHPHIPPGGVVLLRCEVSGGELESDARPSLYMDFSASGLAHVGLLGVTVELLRHGTTADGALAWKVGRIRPGLLA